MEDLNIKQNCLLYYDSITTFKTIVKEHQIDDWFIYALPIEDRKTRIDYSHRYQFLKEQNQKTITTTNEQEIVSWIDTMNFMFYALDHIKNKSGIKIIQELKIPFSNKRPDYVITKDNKILIIEFSFKKLGDDYQYENKLTQAIGYKELLSNLLPNHIQIGTYTYLMKPEIEKSGKQILVQSKYTNEEVDTNYDGRLEMAKYIDEFFSTTKKTAFEELLKIVI